MQVWRAHSEKSETVYWFFRLKNGYWYRFDPQFYKWLEIQSGQSLPANAIRALVRYEFQLSNVTKRNLAIEWERMFQKHSPPFILADIAP